MVRISIFNVRNRRKQKNCNIWQSHNTKSTITRKLFNVVKKDYRFIFNKFGITHVPNTNYFIMENFHKDLAQVPFFSWAKLFSSVYVTGRVQKINPPLCKFFEQLDVYNPQVVISREVKFSSLRLLYYPQSNLTVNILFDYFLNKYLQSRFNS